MSDIISLNSNILSKLEKEERVNNEKLEAIEILKSNTSDVKILDELNKLNAEISLDQSKNIFIAKTCMIIDEYKNILKTPLSRNKEESLPFIKRKTDLSRTYIEIVRELIREKEWSDIIIQNVKNDEDDKCIICDNNDEECFELNEYNQRICLICSTQQTSIETGISHKDYTRINIVGKFIYNRVLHFQDCIKQYQGKQNCKIPDDVYNALEAKLKSHRLLLDNAPNKYIKYSKVTRNHIKIFLKELKLTKHYENVNLIYYTLTNKRVDEISHLEEKLIEDFKDLVALYDENHGKDKPKELNRKNFMNVQYLLFQLLRRHDHACKIEDFTILKTVDRKLFHDDICKNLFSQLGWKFTPTF
jgi:hypothetical protein